MRKRRGAAIKRLFSVILVIGAVAFFLRTLPVMAAWAQPIAELSALLAMPEGAHSNTSSSASGKQSSKKDTASSQSGQNMVTSGLPSAVNPENIMGNVIETLYTAKSANLSWSNIHISNKTESHTVDIEKEIKIDPKITLNFDGKPEVLIYHTHATEAFVSGDTGYYMKDHNSRTTDTKKNVVRVGDEITKTLEAKGITVLHDKTLHDSPDYDSGYDNSEAAVRNYQRKYPSLKVFLDIHRDAITRENGDKVKPTVKINGKKAAQIMIAVGCQDGGVTGFPNWIQNMRFALRIQQSLETSYPGLARPIYFVGKKYNEFLANGSLLIEMGSEGNTLDEAVYSGELLSDALSEVLKTMKK